MHLGLFPASFLPFWLQAARHGLAELKLMASAVVVNSTSTLAKVTILYQLISYLAWVITLGGYQPCKSWFGSNERSRRHVGATVLWRFIYFYSSTELHPIPVNRFSHTIARKTRSGVRKALFGRDMCSYEIWGCFTLNSPQKWVRMDNYQPK